MNAKNIDDPASERRSVSGVALGWIHIVIIIVVYLLTIGFFYGQFYFATAQNTRDIEQLKQNQVNREQMREFEDDVQRRLQRIEDKLDRDRSMRELR